MTEQLALELGQQALVMTLTLAAPTLVTALVVGVAISIVQAATQINEMTLSFAPKVVAVFVVAAVVGPWLMETMLDYTTRLYSLLPTMVR